MFWIQMGLEMFIPYLKMEDIINIGNSQTSEAIIISKIGQHTGIYLNQHQVEGLRQIKTQLMDGSEMIAYGKCYVDDMVFIKIYFKFLL